MARIATMTVLITFSLLDFVHLNEQRCDIMHFHKCVEQVRDFADGYSFHITSAVELKENCGTKTQAVNCVNDFVSECMPKADKILFKATTGGKLTLVEELCTEGTDVNTGYLQHIDCWEKIVNDTLYCNEMFEKSQNILMQEDMIERLRMFHSCCAFDWHKQCKLKAAEAKCREGASVYLEKVSALLGGRVLSQLCGTSFTSCYELYGVEVENLDKRYSKDFSAAHDICSYVYPSILSILLLFFVTICAK